MHCHVGTFATAHPLQAEQFITPLKELLSALKAHTDDQWKLSLPAWWLHYAAPS